VRQLAQDATGDVAGSYGGGVQARDATGACCSASSRRRPGRRQPEQFQFATGPTARCGSPGRRAAALGRGGERFRTVPGAPDDAVYGFALAGDGAVAASHGALEAYRWDGARCARAPGDAATACRRWNPAA
jgi:hypothetical protein